MSKLIQLRRGTTAENNAFTGAIGELVMDTELNQLRIHDGVTQGGHTISDGLPQSIVVTLTNLQYITPEPPNSYFYANDITSSQINIPYVNSTEEMRIYFHGMPSAVTFDSRYIFITGKEASSWTEEGDYILSITDGVVIIGKLTGMPDITQF